MTLSLLQVVLSSVVGQVLSAKTMAHPKSVYWQVHSRFHVLLSLCVLWSDSLAVLKFWVATHVRGFENNCSRIKSKQGQAARGSY